MTSFLLTIDTAAPVVTWGGTSGTTAGQKFVIGYSLDEPAAVAARVVLADARSLAATLFSNRIEVLLPADAPAGVATVQLDVKDDVGNAATRTTTVLLSGAPAAPPPAPPAQETTGFPRVPAPRQRPSPTPAPQRHEGRVRVATSSSSSVTARLEHAAQVKTTVSTYVRARAQSAESSRLGPRTLTTVRVSASHTVQIGVRATSDWRRRDDPALLALLLVD